MENKTPTSLVPELVAAQTLGRPTYVEEVPCAVLPDGYRLEALERLLDFPKRFRGDFAVTTADGFNAAVKLYRDDDPERCAELPIFFERSGTSAKIQAVLNPYSWRDFTVTLSQGLSDPFVEWYRLNKTGQSQRQFALFLDERTAHVVKPDGAALLELARKFKANTSVRYQSFIEDSNGDGALEFIQTTEAGSASAKGRMKVPERITLCLPVWHGAAPVKFDCRFGYSISDDGKLSLSVEILNLNALLADELRKVVAAIAKEHKSAVVIEGQNQAVRPL